MIYLKTMSERELVDVCLSRKWKRVREIITADPRLVSTTRSACGSTPVHWIIREYGDMLQFVLNAILSLELQEDQRIQMFRDTFERGDNFGCTPAHDAAGLGRIMDLMFLVRHCPSGSKILEVRDTRGWTPAHYAAYRKQIDTLDFLLQNAPSGIAILEAKTVKGDTPLDLANKKFRDRFSLQKIKEFGLRRELRLIRDQNVSGSFVELVLDLLQENCTLCLRGVN